MASLWNDKKHLNDMIALLQNNKVPFNVLVTSHSARIISDWGDDYIFSNNKYTYRDLHLINAVKNHVRNTKHNANYKKLKKYPKQSQIKYFKFNIPRIKKNKLIPVEIDVSTAYWRTAFNLGVIDTALYKKAHNYSRTARLVALGALAKKEWNYRFTGRSLCKSDKPQIRNTDKYWNLICYKLGQVMSSVAKAVKRDFLFFWVDNIIVKPRAAGKVVKLLRKYGYNCKIRKLDYIKLDKFSVVIKRADEKDPSPFCFPNSNVPDELDVNKQCVKIKSLFKTPIL